MLDTSTAAATTGYRCLICGTRIARAAGLCSPSCRTEAESELRRNRVRSRNLRRGLHVLTKDRFELRRLDDRNAELQDALTAARAIDMS